MDPVTLLQSTEIAATQHIFKQNYVSCICFCQKLFFFFFFSPNGAFALSDGAGCGAGESEAAEALLGFGDGDNTKQPFVPGVTSSKRFLNVKKKKKLTSDARRLPAGS